ncbi:MAG: hypothetical protein AB7P04_06185 [Bacteriovoracia bacterium]
MDATRVRSLLPYLLIPIFTWLSNFFLVPKGLALHDSDQAFYPLAAEHFYRFGEWSFFPFTQTYGGTAYTWLRALWVGGLERLGVDFLRAHWLFSYWVTPTLIAWANTWMVSRFAWDKAGWQRARWVGAIVASIGFVFWSHLAGIDIYMMLPIGGALLLGLGAGFRAPLMDMPRGRLFWFSVLGGFCAYNFRPFLIYVVAVLFPWRYAWDEFLALVRGRSVGARITTFLFVGALTLFAAGLLIGRELGHLRGKAIKLDPGPNLDFAILIFAAWVAIRGRTRWREIPYARGAITLGGLALGFLPQVIYSLRHGSNSSWTKMGMDSLGVSRLFTGTYELLTGLPNQIVDSAPFRWEPVLIVVIAMAYLLLAWIKHRQTQLTAPVMVVALNFAAFLGITMTSPGAARYLFPIFPTLILAMALLFQSVGPLARPAVRSVLLVLLSLSLFYQLHQRYAWATQPRVVAKSAQMWEVIDTFRRSGVKYVWTDDFWESVTYSLASRENPIFGSEEIPWPEPPHWKFRHAEPSVGVLLSGKRRRDPDGSIQINGRKLRLQALKDVGGFRLYLGN